MTDAPAPLPKWFADYQEAVIGHSYIVDLIPEAPNRLRMDSLCDGPGSTVLTMPALSTRADAETWWASKITAEPGG